MDKNISKETIEIGGVEYTLFMNRTGLVSWERHTKLQEKGEKYQEQFKEDVEIEITDDTDPFTMYSDIDVDESIEEAKEIYVEFYWTALYTYHKLNIKEARELFNKAVKEYGFQQLVDLALQMIEDMNTDKFSGGLKNLKALRPKN